MCVLCKAIIRSETVWPVHLNSKTHKENIALAKKTKLETDPTKVQTFKRPMSPSQESSTNKKIKGILKNSTAQSAQVSSSLPADFFDNPKQVNGTVSSSIPMATQWSEDNKEPVHEKDLKNAEVEEEKEKDKSKDTNQPPLPEGFFDDPVLDAKVRPLSLESSTKSNCMIFMGIFRFVTLNIKILLKRNGKSFKKKLKRKRHNLHKSLQMIKKKQQQKGN